MPTIASASRVGAAAQLYRLLSSPSTTTVSGGDCGTPRGVLGRTGAAVEEPPADVAAACAGSSVAIPASITSSSSRHHHHHVIIAGGWADWRVGDHAAALQAALPGTPVVCTGGILRADARERAAALEDYEEYRGGPVPAAPEPSAQRIAVAIGEVDAAVRVETTSTTIVEQGVEAANGASELRPGADMLLLVASPYQRMGMQIAISAAAPTARVTCVDNGGGVEADVDWFAAHGRNLHALMLAEAARLQSAHPGPEHASRIEQIASAAQRLDDSIRADAAQLAAAVAARGVKVVCWDMDRTFMAAHSRGRMAPWLLPSFASRVAPDFIRFSEALQLTGCVLQAVATHSDFAEHGPEKPEGEYIIGEPLVRAVGELSFPKLLQWPIVAYNPRARALKAREAAGTSHDDTAVKPGGQADTWEGRGDSDENRDKRYHLRTIAKILGCGVAECMLIDDMPENVDTANADGAHGVLVGQPAVGFRLDDIETWLRHQAL